MVQTRTRKQRDVYDSAPVAKRLRPRVTGSIGIVTWNMQGTGSDADKSALLKKLMGMPDAAVVCLQECGVLFGWPSSPLSLPIGWNVSTYIRWTPSGINPRCSMAILTKGIVEHKKSSEAVRRTQRPVMGVKFLGHWFFNVHAPRHNIPYVREALTFCRTTAHDSKRWFCFGDFNLIPERAPSDSAIIARCNSATHQSAKRELDYGFASSKNAFGHVTERIPSLVSDHCPVYSRFSLV